MEPEWRLFPIIKEMEEGTSLVVQGMGPHGPSVGGLGLFPGQGTRSHKLQSSEAN